MDATLATISGEQSKVKKDLEQLGEALETLSEADVLTALYSKVGLPACLPGYLSKSPGSPAACKQFFLCQRLSHVVCLFFL